MPEISIIIPAFNEEQVIGQTITNVVEFLKDTDFILIVVNDGSTDSTTNIVRDAAAQDSRIQLLSLKKNQGRGGALTYALSQCTTTYAVYFDADLQTNLSLFYSLLSDLRRNVDIVIGSKHHPQSIIEYPYLRRFASKGYSFLTQLFLRCPVKDYQCGFKGFNVQKIKRILPSIHQRGWSWDTEIIVKSHWAGFSIKEFPVNVKTVYARKSKVHLLKDIYRMGKGIVEILLDKPAFITYLNATKNNSPPQTKVP